MSELLSKLNYIKETKTLMAEAIVNKGGNVSDNNFKEFANSITALAPSSEWTLPANLYNGMILWIDATCNTQNGFDESVPYLTPILRAPTSHYSNMGAVCYYKSKTSGTFDGKFLDLGDNGAFKVNRPFFDDPMTIELVFKITKPPTENLRLMHASKYLAYILVSDDGYKFSFSQIEDGVHDIEIGKPYYQVIRYSGATGASLITYPSGDKYENTEASYTDPGASIYLGFGTGGSTSNTFSADYTYSTGYGFGMCRCWNRLLTDDEITRNWQEVQTRFEI